MRTDLASGFSVSTNFKWNLVALDSDYIQTDFVELDLALVRPTGVATPTDSTVPIVIDVDESDDDADPLLVG